MTFEEWWKNESGWGGDILLAEGHLAKAAWNAAIEAATIAVESSDHNSDDSGIGANCNAMTAVENLKSL